MRTSVNQNVPALRRYRRARPVDDLEHQRQQRVRGERVAQRRDLVRDAAERPHVGFERVRLVRAHLRGEVIRRPRHRRREVVCALQHLRDAKVAQLHHAAPP
eukprot:30843-Pelagococcus_subviridis.AAC.5